MKSEDEDEAGCIHQTRKVKQFRDSSGDSSNDTVSGCRWFKTKADPVHQRQHASPGSVNWYEPDYRYLRLRRIENMVGGIMPGCVRPLLYGCGGLLVIDALKGQGLW